MHASARPFTFGGSHTAYYWPLVEVEYEIDQNLKKEETFSQNFKSLKAT